MHAGTDGEPAFDSGLQTGLLLQTPPVPVRLPVKESR